MRLIRARVTNFKCVMDSNWFTVDDLTCLVGKNESGKTAILEALEKLGSVDPERADFRASDYPRLNYGEYEESGEAGVALHTEWALDDDEVAYINNLTGADILASKTIELTKGYDNKVNWTVQLDYKKAAKALLEKSGLDANEREPLANIQNVIGLVKVLTEIPRPTPGQQALLDDLNRRFPSGGLLSTIDSFLYPRMPKFVYYSQYDRLPGRVSLEQLVAARQSGQLHNVPGAKVFLALLSLVGTTPERIGQISSTEKLIANLETAENRLTKRIFKYWSQNRHLQVRFRFDQGNAEDPPPFNSGRVFQTRIYNSRHKATTNLEDRSTGFIWFFSFLVWFSEVTRAHGDNLIVLLDEPGLSLHARAQRDLLRFIEEELLPKHQVIYTTHSPFMIDPANLLSCRTVEDIVTDEDEVLGTKVGDDVLSAGRDTLFPLQAALGYDITRTIFVGRHCLLVDHPSDLLYLRWASEELAAWGRHGLDARWTVTPCGGAAKVSSFVGLFATGDMQVAVLTGYTSGNEEKVRELRESDLLRRGHVFTPDMYLEAHPAESDVEDLLGRDFYVDLVNAAYGLEEKEEVPTSVPADGERVVREVEEHFQRLRGIGQPEYDQHRPARYLLEHRTSLMVRDKAQALDRFEQLFRDLNDLLPGSPRS